MLRPLPTCGSSKPLPASTRTNWHAIVGAHLIDTKALRHADFEAFFLARRRALLGLVEQAMGKRAQQDVEAGALTGGEEAPEVFADEADDPEDTDVIVSVLSR